MTSSGGSRLIQLGAFIREQRKHAQLSLRNLAAQAGVSNPYLSQIERGLRKPSAEILQAIARALRISAETLYVKAGILEERGDDLSAAILGDSGLTERQRLALLEVYRSFRQETAAQETAAQETAAQETAAQETAAQETANQAAVEPEPEPGPGNAPEGS